MEDIKVLRQTKKGTWIRTPVTIERRDGRIYFFKSANNLETPFALKNEIKTMQGYRWHGYRDPGEGYMDGKKVWSCLDSCRNNFSLDFLTGGNPYANWEKPLETYQYERPLRAHQEMMSNHCLTYHYKILAAEMGCISGDAIVHCNRRGKGFSLTLRELCYKFQGGATYNGDSYRCISKRRWEKEFHTYIRGFTGSGLGLIKILDVVLKGVQDTLVIKLKSGQELVCTPDHEICVGAKRYGLFREARNLNPGDYVMVAASEFKKDTSVIQYPPEVLVKTTKRGYGVSIDRDGYVKVSGLPNHPRNNKGQVYEHIVVMEDLIGRNIQCGEIVHHINHQRWDNRPENLLLVASNAKHARMHSSKNSHNVFASKPSVYYYSFEEVVEISKGPKTDVYDVVCEGPYHNFVADGVVCHNCGKTLSAIEVLERSGFEDWWWVAPKSGLAAVELEFDKWHLRFKPRLMTYDRLRMIMKTWTSGEPAPRGVIFDESSRLKGATSQRTKAAQALADAIRREYGWDGYVILMSGTPSPKSPVDWWSQMEICYPGFIKEGTAKIFEQRLRIFKPMTIDGSTFWQPVAWRDDTGRCNICGQFQWIENEDQKDIEREGRWKLDCDGNRIVRPNHDLDDICMSEDAHAWVPSKNEVAYLHERLDGLVLPLAKKDCWDLPDKIYREVVLEPSTTIKRVARGLLSAATTAIQGITWLRELSDGFQYKQEIDPENPTKPCPVCKGVGECEQWFFEGEKVDYIPNPEDLDEFEKRLATCEICNGSGLVDNFVKTTKEIRCPKEQAVRDLLEENEDQGRLVIFAGFRGSIDRIVNICHKQQWDVVRVDGRGWKVLKADGNHPTAKSVKPLHYWADTKHNARVAFVAHPESGGMGLTLTESRMAVFYSNDFKPESRMQAEDRIHRPGIDENKGATIVDLFHLGSDRKVLNVLRDNRRLEQLTLGELQELEL